MARHHRDGLLASFLCSNLGRACVIHRPSTERPYGHDGGRERAPCLPVHDDGSVARTEEGTATRWPLVAWAALDGAVHAAPLSGSRKGRCCRCSRGGAPSPARRRRPQASRRSCGAGIRRREQGARRHRGTGEIEKEF